MNEKEIKDYAREVIGRLSKTGDRSTLNQFVRELNKLANLRQYQKLLPPEGIMITNREEQYKLKRLRMEEAEFTPERMAIKLLSMTNNQKVKFLNKLSKLVFEEQASGFKMLDEFISDVNLSDNSKIIMRELHYRMNENQ